MIKRNQELKLNASAKIVYGEKTKTVFRKTALEKLVNDIENISDEVKRLEAFIALDCILSGNKVVLTQSEEIHLYTNMELTGKIGPNWIITKNQELYSLLKNSVLS